MKRILCFCIVATATTLFVTGTINAQDQLNNEFEFLSLTGPVDVGIQQVVDDPFDVQTGENTPSSRSVVETSATAPGTLPFSSESARQETGWSFPNLLPQVNVPSQLPSDAAPEVDPQDSPGIINPGMIDESQTAPQLNAPDTSPATPGSVPAIVGSGLPPNSVPQLYCPLGGVCEYELRRPDIPTFTDRYRAYRPYGGYYDFEAICADLQLRRLELERQARLLELQRQLDYHYSILPVYRVPYGFDCRFRY